MTQRPRLTSIDLWANHERRCLSILREALGQLDLPTTENEVGLNRRLYRSIISVSHAIATSEHTEVLPVVVPEGRNPPAGSDTERAARENKIPDFYWAYIDHLAADPLCAARQFVVECKRLTSPSRTWTYTEEYVRSGIVRFVSVEHGYGKDAPSGAMVGYLQDIDAGQALAEVNACVVAENLPILVLCENDSEVTAEFDHQLDRPFPDSPFRLLHLWLRADHGADR